MLQAFCFVQEQGSCPQKVLLRLFNVHLPLVLCEPAPSDEDENCEKVSVATLDTFQGGRGAWLRRCRQKGFLRGRAKGSQRNPPEPGDSSPAGFMAEKELE